MPAWTPLPNRLVWAPEGHGRPTSGIYQELDALDLCEHAGGKPATYHVTHYTQEATGYTFGPLGLDMVLHFCRGLDAVLSSGKSLVLTTPEGDVAYRLNALVLLGSFLIMKHGWTAKKLTTAVGQDAKAKFVCSWSRKFTEEADRVLTVEDCWAGLELASTHQWIDTACIEDDSKLQAFVERYRHTSLVFDATWVIPDLLMVAADPVSVICDASPVTCKSLFPSEGASTACSESSDEGEPAFHEGRVVPVPRMSLASLETVCKDYGGQPGDQDWKATGLDSVPEDFVGFFQQSRIGLIVRANWSREEGVPIDAYGDEAFRRFGVEQANIRVIDKRGGLPRPEDVARMIKTCEDFLDPGQNQPAVLVHCKGGFGRSMILGLCLAIHRFNLPGAALLGWVRMARPGSITCREQELFLKSLTGRAAVARFAKLRTDDKCHQSCEVGCTLQ